MAARDVRTARDCVARQGGAERPQQTYGTCCRPESGGESASSSERSISFAAHAPQRTCASPSPAVANICPSSASKHAGCARAVSARLRSDAQRPATADGAPGQAQRSSGGGPRVPSQVRAYERSSSCHEAHEGEQRVHQGPPQIQAVWEAPREPRLGWRGAVLAASTLLSAGGHHMPRSRSPSPAPAPPARTACGEDSTVPSVSTAGSHACETLHSPRRWQAVKAGRSWTDTIVQDDVAALRSKVAQCQQYLCATRVCFHAFALPSMFRFHILYRLVTYIVVRNGACADGRSAHCMKRSMFGASAHNCSAGSRSRSARAYWPCAAHHIARRRSPPR